MLEGKVSMFTPEYDKANSEFTEVMGKGLSFSKKLQKLENLADQMGTNPQNIKHFNDTILERWVKGKDKKLYDAYQASLKELA